MSDDFTLKFEIKEVDKVNLQEGDILFVRFNRRMTDRYLDQMRDFFNDKVLGPMGLKDKVKVIIAESDIEISVLTTKIQRCLQSNKDANAIEKI